MAKNKKKNDTFLGGWSEAILHHKTKVKRYFKKEDAQRETPYLFDGWRRDFQTGQKLVSFHTKKGWDDELDSYPSYVLPYESFMEQFEEVEVEI